MKILIGYDGSPASESALDGLTKMGLPVNGEALVVTIAEIWLPPPEASVEEAGNSAYLEEILARYREKGERLLNEAQTMAKYAVTRVRKSLPDWTVRKRVTYGSPGWELLTAADEYKPEIIVVGSHGHSVLNRVLLGSISQKVMTEAHCTVRISRKKNGDGSGRLRLMIGFDGSAGANAAVDTVAKRTWPAGTEVQLVAATASVVPTAIGRFIQPVTDWIEDEHKAEHDWIASLADKASQLLTGAGLNVTTLLCIGNPNHVLVTEAEKWAADCIFVGANAFGSRLERYLLGSTSSAVATRAHCSVEVVRK